MTRQKSWTKLFESPEVWECEYLVPNFRSRTLAVALGEDTVLVYSPGLENAATFRESPLGGRSQVILLAPNSYHHMGILAWKREFPGAKIYAGRSAVGRLKRLGYKEVRVIDSELYSFSESVSIKEVPHTTVGELWIKIATNEGSAWIIGDAFFNYDRFAKRPVARVLQKIMKAAPGLKVSQIAKLFMFKNRPLYKTWILNELDVDQPKVLVPLHGVVKRSSELPAEIRAVVEERF